MHPNAAMLRTLYRNPTTTVDDYAHYHLVLHPALGPAPLRGRTAAVDHFRDLDKATVNTLFWDVEYVTATDYFGTVHGTIRASKPGRFTMPFCGMWRFRDDGWIVEHWETFHDPAKLEESLLPTGQGQRL